MNTLFPISIMLTLLLILFIFYSLKSNFGDSYTCDENTRTFPSGKIPGSYLEKDYLKYNNEILKSFIQNSQYKSN
jgi:hypothetical protein